MTQRPNTDILDIDAMLAASAGDTDLLRELVALFLEDAPKLMADIGAAIERADANALMRAAHRLKGSVGVIRADRALELAQRLEQMGRQEELIGAAEVYAALEAELERLNPALAALLSSF